MSASAAAATGAPSLPTGVEGQYCFLVEYFDAQAALMRQYHLLYFLLDDTIEVRHTDTAHTGEPTGMLEAGGSQ
jgi:hypothetical protein